MSPAPLMVHRIPGSAIISDRRVFISKACENRTVLHLGCAEWPRTVESLQDGTLLHMALSRVSKRIFGIDLSESGLSILRNHGFRDLICWDAEKLDQLTIDVPIEVIVAGEILEHLSNPGLFLQGIAKFMKYSKCRLIVTVPNAFSFRHFVSFMCSKTELVMPDHTAYYSFTTLATLLGRYNLRVCEAYSYTNVDPKSSTLNRFAKRALNVTLLQAFPQVSEGIIAVAENVNDSYNECSDESGNERAEGLETAHLACSSLS